MIYFAKSDFNFFVEGQSIRMESAAYQIESEFVKTIDDLEFVMSSLNRKIANSTANKNAINHILQSANYSALKNQQVYSMLSNGTFFWIDQNRQLLLSSEFGIIQTPINVSAREYLSETEKTAWKIFLGQPAIGAASRQHVIPVGVGVTNSAEKYLGTLAAGLKVEDLVKKFAHIAVLYQSEFAVIDQKNRVLVESRDGLFSQDHKLINALNNHTYSAGNEIILDHSLFLRSDRYVISRGFEKYPYTVLISKNNGVITRAAWMQEIMPHFIEWLIISVFFISLRYFIRTSLRK